MDFLEAIATQKMELGAVAPVNEAENETAAVLTDSDIPESMPLTNRLDKMTVDQGAWAIRNGTAWIAYLKANGVEVYQSPATASATDIEVTPAEVHNAICQTLENVWLAMLKESGGGTLELERILDWVDTLQWAVSAMPAGYDRQAAIIQEELDSYQALL